MMKLAERFTNLLGILYYLARCTLSSYYLGVFHQLNLFKRFFLVLRWQVQLFLTVRFLHGNLLYNPVFFYCKTIYCHSLLRTMCTLFLFTRYITLEGLYSLIYAIFFSLSKKKVHFFQRRLLGFLYKKKIGHCRAPTLVTSLSVSFLVFLTFKPCK